MTRGTLVSRVGQAIGMAYDIAGSEQTLLYGWANQAVKDILVKTHCKLTLGQVTLTSGVADYRLDAAVLALDDRNQTGSVYDIRVVSIDEMYDLRRLASAYDGTNVLSIAAQGDLLLVWPTPTATQTIDITYVAVPTAMTSDANDTTNTTFGGLPSTAAAELALEYFMLWRAAEYDDKATPQRPVEYYALYQKQLVDMKKELRRMSGRSLTPARVGYPSRRSAGTRNDTYPSR